MNFKYVFGCICAVVIAGIIAVTVIQVDKQDNTKPTPVSSTSVSPSIVPTPKPSPVTLKQGLCIETKYSEGSQSTFVSSISSAYIIDGIVTCVSGTWTPVTPQKEPTTGD